MAAPAPASPVIGVAPYELRPGPDLAATPLADLAFPLGLPAGLEGGRIGDLGPDDHLVFYPKNGFYLRWPPGLRAQVSLVVAEPRAVHRRHLRLLRLFHGRFFRVLTRDPDLCAAIPNARRFAHAFAFVSPEADAGREKPKTLSVIASAKRQLPGHRLRHDVIRRLRARGVEADILGRGYAPFERKEDGLAPYRYSVVIENSREPGYFSEKLIDALLCRTVPLYWGAPDIDAWFDPGGLLACDGAEELVDTAAGLADRDPDAFAEAVEENRRRALPFLDPARRVASALAAEIA